MSQSWYLRCVPNLWGTLYSQSSNPVLLFIVDTHHVAKFVPSRLKICRFNHHVSYFTFIKLKRECVSVMSRNFRLAARFSVAPVTCKWVSTKRGPIVFVETNFILGKTAWSAFSGWPENYIYEKLKVSLLWSTKKTWRRPSDERLLSSTSGHQANGWLSLTSADFTDLLTTVLL